ncbi:PAS domain-containing protein [Taibaiella soli]|uniref:histidine kinase n=1 Tax=Taibaiella soli TaxID=1649169 RepID=A0A2W2AL26_9BACT|nr:PAS domain-containing protein [Taibaiella soli]PZF73000.1 hypothetical protein DN068_11360 [Taibaiella soli]
MCLEQALIDFETYSKSHDNNLICLHEANGTYLHVGESCKNVTGFEMVELIGKNPYDYFHPDDHERIQNCAHFPVLEGKETVQIEFRFRNKNNEYIWLKSKILPIRDEAGNVVSFFSISKDITIEVEIKEGLAQKEKLFNQVGSIAKIGSWEYDVTNGELLWSKAIYDIYELHYDYIPTKETLLRFCEDDISRNRFEQALDEVTGKGISSDFTLPLITTAETKVWAHIILKPEISKGKTTKILGVVQDVTADMEMRNKLKTLVDELTAQNRQLEGLLQSLPLIF